MYNMHISWQSSNLFCMRSLAAELLARTVLRLFPTVRLVEGGSNSLGFFYDFVFEQPLTEGLADLIESQLRSAIKEGEEVRSISMMRENAQAFFQHHHQPFLAYQAAKAGENILSLVQIGDFYGLCPPLPFTSTQEAGHVKFLSCHTFPCRIEDEERTVTRFIGTTQKTAKDLKHFLKDYDLFLKRGTIVFWGPDLIYSVFPNRWEYWEPFGIPRE